MLNQAYTSNSWGLIPKHPLTDQLCFSPICWGKKKKKKKSASEQ